MSGILWLCFGLSGAAALALEVLWMRSAGLVLGATAPTMSSVLACNFAGLGLGAARARGTQRQPVRLYGLLELGAGLGAVWSLVVFRALASDPILSYAVVSPDDNLSNLDRWYERGPAERTGGFVIYHLRLRPSS